MPVEQLRKNPDHHDVFISYAQQDKPIADAVCAKLESRNIRCWIAPRDISPGKNFPEAIIEGIEDGKVVVLIFSSFANKSPHVTRELTNAVNKGRIIIPFRIEDVIPSKSMEYLIGVPHWLDAVSPPLEKHIDQLVGIVESIINPERRPHASPEAAPGMENSQIAEVAPTVSPGMPAQDHLPEPGRHIMAALKPAQKTFVIAGVFIAAIIILVLGMQMGMFHFIKSPDMSGSVRPSLSAPVNYQSSDATVNTVVLTTEPTQTLAKDTELYVDVSKDDSNAMVLIQFNGGPGMGLVKENQVILTRSDGTVTTGNLDFSQRLSEIRLQGTRGTDRIQVRVTLYSGEIKIIVDKLLPYRTYR
jgi:hypothetical protein